MKTITASLGEITEIISGTTPKSTVSKYWNGQNVWITPTDLGKNQAFYLSNSDRKITEEGLESCNLKKIPKGSIVMSSRAPIGHLAISGCDLYTNQGCKSFVPNESALDSEFLYFLLRHRMLDIQALGSGATFLEVSKTALENFFITFPEKLTQQCHIATQLKTQLAEVETARKALQCQKQEIVNLANAYIRESVEQSPVIETRLGEVLEEVKKGIGETWVDYPVLGATRDGLAPAKSVGAGHARDLSHPGAHSRSWPAPTKVEKGIGENGVDDPVLGATRDGLAPAKTVGAGHARDLGDTRTHSRAWPAPMREAPGKHPQRYKPVFSGTVFYKPMRILIGSIAFVDDDDEPGITSPDYVALQGKAGQVDSRWFYYWLRSPYGEHCINSLARGAVRERMLFNRLAEGSIRLPTYPEQLRVSKALATLKPVKSAIQKQLDDLNKLPERLLAQAFNNVIPK